MSGERIEIDVPEDVSAEVDHLDLTVEGPSGSVTRRLWFPSVTVTVEEVDRETEDGGSETVEAVVVAGEEDDAETNATVGTFASHVRNAFQGVTDGWEYRMEVFYNHFPMQVEVEGDEVLIENFLGERAPRRAEIRGDTRVEVDGEEVTLTGPNKEDVGQTAADIEQLTRVKGKDSRIFQDGVYITEKPERAGEA
jgi:large subunit ribosomal protein L6